ncbi:MAG: hypothetical protein AAB400_00440 [Patescibacteria group bacterium]
MGLEYPQFNLEGADGQPLQGNVGILTLEELEYMMASISPSAPLGMIGEIPEAQSKEHKKWRD